jgi:hypothetical protein
MTEATNNGNETLAEEIEAINAIYGPSTLISSPHPHPDSAGADPILILQLPSQPFSFRFSFPTTYPSGPPSILGTETTHGSSTGDGRWAVGVLHSTLERIFKKGEVCLYDLIEEASVALGASRGEDGAAIALESGHQFADYDLEETHDPNDQDQAAAAPSAPIEPPPWILSIPITEKKSLFIARAAPVASLAQATTYLDHLLSTNKKISTATHNISAWRIHGPTGTTIQDFDDDGETAAGGRLLHLMQLMDVWDVVVVVSRWYGGVKLGPDRFRIINAVAREALVKGGFGGDGKEKEKEEGHGKRKGKR